MADNDRFDRIESRIDGLAVSTLKAINRLAAETRAGFSWVDMRFDDVHRELRNHERRLGNIETRVEGVELPWRYRVGISFVPREDGCAGDRAREAAPV